VNPYLTPALASLALRLLAVTAILLAWLAPATLGPRAATDTVLLIDRSRSVPEPVAAAARTGVERALAAAGATPAVTLEFAGQVGAPGEHPLAATLDPDRTDLEAALDAGLRRFRAGQPGTLVVVSDGWATEGNPEATLRAARAAGIAVRWVGVGREPPAARVMAVEAPQAVNPGTSVALRVQVAVREPRAARLEASSDDGQLRSIPLAAQRGLTAVPLTLVAPAHGPLVVHTAVLAADGTVIDPRRITALVAVAERPAILYVGDAPAPFAASLARGGYDVTQRRPGLAPTSTAVLAAYASVVLDDVPLDGAPAGFWAALTSAVRSDGVGLVALGGPNSFGAGDYRGSALESLLPVLAEPPADGDRTAIVFAVDKSGSMGRGSGGVDRLALARAAVAETAALLAPRDELGLVVFDVAPRVLVPLQSADIAATPISAAWPVGASGGTRIAPALEAAASLLAGAGSPRRIAVLVTDAYVADEPLAAARLALAQAGAELVVFAVGADADVGALQRGLGRTIGDVYRIGRAAELPTLMHRALAIRMSRIARGPIQPRRRLAAPFPPDRADWPEVAAAARVRARPTGANVHLDTDTGLPLLATGLAGNGRVAALPAGLGAWAPRWLAWSGWPDFAGGLIDWSRRGSVDPRLGLAVAAERGTVTVDADFADGDGWSVAPSIAVEVRAPSGRVASATALAAWPGHYRATLPAPTPGPYAVTARAGSARSQRLVLVGPGPEDEGFGVAPAVDDWQRGGLIVPWGAAPLAAPLPDRERGRAWLMAIALALVIGAIVVDTRGVLIGRVRRLWPRAGPSAAA
jgi:hypothetical protein